jgi:hypothetical protein
MHEVTVSSFGSHTELKRVNKFTTDVGEIWRRRSPQNVVEQM